MHQSLENVESPLRRRITNFHGPLSTAVRRNPAARRPSNIRVFIDSNVSYSNIDINPTTTTSNSSSNTCKVETSEGLAVTQLSPLSQPGARSQELKRSLMFYMKIFNFLFGVSSAIYLQNRVAKLEEGGINLQRLCNNKDVAGNESLNVWQLEDYHSTSNFDNEVGRIVALYTVVVTLIIPFVLYKYLDYLPQINNLLKRTKTNKEEVPLKKRIAYLVDVCFSVYPYAKLLALLFSIMFLIIFGGLALYAIGSSSFAEALWLSWSYVADSGNHADRVGTGPRIVSVCISIGGMLIFVSFCIIIISFTFFVVRNVLLLFYYIVECFLVGLEWLIIIYTIERFAIMKPN